MKNKLIAFASLDDPYWAGIIHTQEQKGPVLSALARHETGALLLVNTPETAGAAERLCKALPRDVKLLRMELKSTASDGIKALTLELTAHKESLAEFSEAFILDSGSPQQRAALWILRYEGALKGEVLSETIQIPEADFTAPPRTPKQLKVTEPPKEFGDELSTPDLPWAAVAKRIGCVGRSPRFTRTLEEAAMLANHSAPVLLIGETGSGKEVLAKFIHALSPRAVGPLVTVNCAALPEGLAESLLFGHEKGSFTGALKRQKGKFELANGGTLFLDEIGELTLANQAKLLRVLEEKKVDALGSEGPLSVDVRIIAATNRDLGQEVAKGGFREDLYYRLRAGEVLIPPLRERGGDIPLIAMHILTQFNLSLAAPKQFSRETLKFLEAQPWPGNVRDLMNTIERAALLCPREVLEPGDFKTDYGANKTAVSARMDGGVGGPLPILHPGFSLEDYLAELREEIVGLALRQTGGKQSEAARLLGMSPQAVSKYVKKGAATVVEK